MDITLEWKPSGLNPGTDLRQCKYYDDMADSGWPMGHDIVSCQWEMGVFVPVGLKITK